MALRRAPEKNHDRPILLNEKMRVHSYDGGSFKNRTQYQVKNVLIPTLEPFHCSGQGKGPFNLVLKMVQASDFTLTHLYLLGPGKKCTEPIKSCLVFVTQEPPNVANSKFFDGLSPEELTEYVDGEKELPTGEDAPIRPVVYFSTEKESREVELQLPKWITGKYVLVKFMSTHNNQENMDVGVVGLVGYASIKQQPEQCDLGPWLHRSVLSPFVHPSRLKSMFSSSGWVCDGRDSSGGCRSGQTDFHQTSVYTVTFRCTATGLDLCESCAYDPTLGQVTSEFARTDIQELKDPQTAKLVAGRIRNALRRNWRRSLPMYLEQEFLTSVVTLLETNCLPLTEERNNSREQGRLPKIRGGFHFHQRPQLTLDAQRKVMRKALFQILHDICCVVFSLASSPEFLVNESVYAREDTAPCSTPRSNVTASTPVTPPLLPPNTPAAGLGGVNLHAGAPPHGGVPPMAAGDGDTPMTPGPAGIAEGYHEARIMKPSNSNMVASNAQQQPTSNASMGKSGLTYCVNWTHRLKQSTVPAEDVWKVQKEDMLSPSLELRQELIKGPQCDAQEVKRLLEGKADAAACDGLGETLLYKAIVAKVNVQVLELLIEHGACVDCAVWPNGATPLDMAEGELADKLREHGASMSGDPESMVPLDEQVEALRSELVKSTLCPLLKLVEKVSKGSETERSGFQPLNFYIQSDRSPEILEAVAHLTSAAPIHLIAALVKEDHSTFIALKRMLETFVLQDTAPSVYNCLKIANNLSQVPTLRNMVLSIGARDWALTIMERASELSKNDNKGLSHQISEEATKLLSTLAYLEPPAVESLSKLVQQIKNASSWKMKTLAFGQLMNRLLAEESIKTMDQSCSSYELSKADGPQVLLGLLETPQGPEFFTELFNANKEGAQNLVKTILGVVELGERFSVWRYKKDKGLKSLVDPLTLKLKHLGSKVCSPATSPSFNTSVEPLTTVAELTNYLLSVTPVANVEYLRYCYDLVGGEITLMDGEKNEEEEWDVAGFEVITDCIPLPIHTLARVVNAVREEVKVLLSIREYRVKSAPNHDSAATPGRETRVHLGLLKSVFECEEYMSLLKNPAAFDVKAAMSVGTSTSTSGVHAASGSSGSGGNSETIVASVTESVDYIKKHEGDREVKELINEELARFTARDVSDKNTDNGQVDPNLRVHTVMMTVGEELPFDLIWQMTKEDIMGAVREICPRGSPQTEETIQAGIVQSGMGPIAKNLTLREAENLSSRLGHCIQTAVTIDQAAVEKERAREKQSTGHLALTLGSRIKYSKTRGSEDSQVGVLVGIHEKDQRFSLLDASSGILHEQLPRSSLKSGGERRQDRWGGADILSQTDLIRLRDHLRRRVEVDRAGSGAGAEEETPTSHGHAGGGGWRAAIGDLLEAGAGPRFGPGIIPASAEGGILRPGPLVLRLPAGNEPSQPSARLDEGVSIGPAFEPTDLEESESDSERSAVEMIHQILEEEEGMDDGEMQRLNDEDDGRNDEEMRETPASDIEEMGGMGMDMEQAMGMPPMAMPMGGRGQSEEAGEPRPDDGRVIEQIRMMEEVFSQDLGLGGMGMNGLRIRLGLPGGQPPEGGGNAQYGRYQLRRSSGQNATAVRRTIAKSPLRTQFAAFLRASDSTNPTATLDHPVTKRYSPQDLLAVEPLMDDDECPPSSSQPLVGRATVTPRFGLFEEKPSQDVSKEWTLIRLMQKMEQGPTEKVSLDNWGLSYELHVNVPPRPWNFEAPPKKRRRVAATSGSTLIEEDFTKLDCLHHVTTSICLLGHLHSLALPSSPGTALSDATTFVCQRLDRKLRCQLDDPLAIASGAIPAWAKVLPSQFPFLFSLKTRKLLMKYCGFGLSYCVHWMQDQRLGSFLRRRVALQTDLNTASEPRKIQELSQELSNVEEHVVRSSYWLGGLQTTLIKLEKGDQFLTQAINGLEALSAPNTLIHTVEVQFENETGFGTGVTQSFYTEVANALLNRKENQKYPMWVEDDTVGGDHIGQRARKGLLIRPIWNPDKELLRRFRFLGALMGKALREGFIVPLPLSEEFFALAKGDITLTVDHLPRPGDGYSGEFVGACADFLEELGRNEIEAKTLDFPERFLMTDKNAAEKKAECITFDDYCTLSCASFLETGFDGANLDGEGEFLTDSRSLTVETLGDFVAKAVNFWFRSGVKKQIEAFRKGLGSMLDLNNLQSFTSAELKEMICGSETIEWDRQTLEHHVHPTNGLSRDSPIYKYLIDVLIAMNNADRARFLDFVSSCPRLLPGGKFYMDVCPAPKNQKYPRSRACANQLYLPEYSSREELQTNLFEAMYSSVGHHEQRLTRDL